MVLRKYFKVHYWPILNFVWFITSFIITYTISVLDGHVYVFFPTISDTGATPPESCIFSQLLNIGAVIYGITMYIRYRQINIILKYYEVSISRKWNTFSLWCGICATIGISIAGNFQETEILSIHILGAVMTFSIGNLYLFTQTVFSFAFRPIYYKYPEFGVGPKKLYLRAFLTVSCMILTSISGICGIIAVLQFKGEKISWWTEEDGAFQLRLAASFSEWLASILSGTFILSMRSEYKLMEYEEVRFNSKCPNYKDNEEAIKI